MILILSYFSSIREIDLKSPTVIEMRNKSTILFKVHVRARTGRRVNDREKFIVVNISSFNEE